MLNWRIAVCMQATEENLKMLTEIGIKAIEIPGSLQINPFTVSKEDLRKMRELSNSYGVSIVASNIIYPSGFSHTSNSDRLRRRSIEYTYRLAEAASEIGCPVLVWGSGKARSIPSDVSVEKGFERNLEVLKTAAKAGEEFDVRFGIEPLPKNETNFVNTVEEALKLIENINSEFIGITADIRHMIREEQDLMESLRKAGRRIIHMHLADNNSRVPGRGIIDFSKLFQCFREIGYKDAVSIEARFTDDPREELRFALEVLAKSFSNVS
ncbi:MAG: sugar phosphate isomerase/epimerase [Thaumarchaeota archaeon]|jgi:sugar phosphate isomerase/epimerase|nr:sugar phosphate isomerase/epimerase [Nitrososphaerota archaeon]